MAKQVRLRRGTTAEHADFVGANGEVTVDTVKHVVIVHDGVTAGGWPSANATAVDATLVTLTANAANQAASINTLLANAATQATTLNSLVANAAAQQASINAFVLASNATAIFANIAGVQANVTAANTAITLLVGNAVIQGEAITLANANIIALQSTVANITGANLQNISSNVSPSANVTYDLGTPDRRWRDLYLSGNSIYLGASVISVGGDGRVTLPGLTVTVGQADSIITRNPGGGPYIGTPVIIDQVTYLLANPVNAGSRGDFIPPVYAATMNAGGISAVSIVSPGYWTTSLEEREIVNTDDMWALPQGTPLTWTGLWDAIYEVENIGNPPYGAIGFGVNNTRNSLSGAAGTSTVYGTQSVAGNLTVGGNILPSQANVSTLGTPELPFNHVYVGSGSITIGNATISSTASGITFDSPISYVDNTRYRVTGIFYPYDPGVNGDGRHEFGTEIFTNTAAYFGEIGPYTGNTVPLMTYWFDYDPETLQYTGPNIAACIPSQFTLFEGNNNLRSFTFSPPPVEITNYDPGNQSWPSGDSAIWWAFDLDTQSIVLYPEPNPMQFPEVKGSGGKGIVENVNVDLNAITEYSNAAVSTYLANFDGSISFTASPAIITGLGNIDSAKVWTGNLEFIDGTYQTTANIMAAAFTMANSQHWTTAVYTIGEALNQLAERIYNIENP